jgi:hypothetical protein
MLLRAQNAKLRDQIATLVFQQCLSETPPRQIPSDAQQPLSPSLSSSHFLRADSGPGSAPGTSSSSLARNPSDNLAQSTLFRAPSGASQMMSQLGQQGVSQIRASQAVSIQQLSQQMAEERKKYGLAVGAKDDRIRELDEQLKTLKQTQQAESSSYKNRWALLTLMLIHAVSCHILLDEMPRSHRDMAHQVLGHFDGVFVAILAYSVRHFLDAFLLLIY